MPDQRIITGIARPHFMTEQMSTPERIEYFNQLGVDYDTIINIASISYQILTEGEQIVSSESNNDDAADANMTRDGDYEYTLSVNANSNNYIGALTSAIARADQKISDKYGGN